jgi:hypothetical protein
MDPFCLMIHNSFLHTSKYIWCNIRLYALGAWNARATAFHLTFRVKMSAAVETKAPATQHDNPVSSGNRVLRGNADADPSQPMPLWQPYSEVGKGREAPTRQRGAVGEGRCQHRHHRAQGQPDVGPAQPSQSSRSRTPSRRQPPRRVTTSGRLESTGAAPSPLQQGSPAATGPLHSFISTTVNCRK